MTADFVYLNVPGLLHRYANPPDNWEASVLSWTGEVVAFFKELEWLNPEAQAYSAPLCEVVIRLSDLHEMGRAFVMAAEIEKWLTNFDRQKTRNPKALPDRSKLHNRWQRFSATDA